MKKINGVRDVKFLPAEEIEPGMITVDGVVISVLIESHYRGTDTVFIEHRSTTYAEPVGHGIQVYGRLDDLSTSTLLAGIAESQARR